MRRRHRGHLRPRYQGREPDGDEIVLAPAQAEFYALDIIEIIRQGLIGGGRGTVDGVEVKVRGTSSCEPAPFRRPPIFESPPGSGAERTTLFLTTN